MYSTHPSFTQISSVLAAAINARRIFENMWVKVDLKEPLWVLSIWKKLKKEKEDWYLPLICLKVDKLTSVLQLDYYLQNSVLFIISKKSHQLAPWLIDCCLTWEWWADASKVWSNATTTDCGRCFCAGFSRRSVSLGDVFLLSMLFF